MTLQWDLIIKSSRISSLEPLCSFLFPVLYGLAGTQHVDRANASRRGLQEDFPLGFQPSCWELPSMPTTETTLRVVLIFKHICSNPLTSHIPANKARKLPMAWTPSP